MGWKLALVLALNMECFLASKAGEITTLIAAGASPPVLPQAPRLALGSESLPLLPLSVQIHDFAVVGYGEAFELGCTNLLNLEYRRGISCYIFILVTFVYWKH